MRSITQEEIAERCECDQATVAREIENFMQNGEIAKMHKPAADHLVDAFTKGGGSPDRGTQGSMDPCPGDPRSTMDLFFEHNRRES